MALHAIVCALEKSASSRSSGRGARLSAETIRTCLVRTVCCSISGCLLGRSRSAGGRYTFGFVRSYFLVFAPCPNKNADGGWLQCEDPVLPALWCLLFWCRIGNPCHDEILNPVERIAPLSSGGGGVRAIFIAVGYRVSVLGFLAGDALNFEGIKGGELRHVGPSKLPCISYSSALDKGPGSNALWSGSTRTSMILAATIVSSLSGAVRWCVFRACAVVL